MDSRPSTPALYMGSSLASAAPNGTQAYRRSTHTFGVFGTNVDQQTIGVAPRTERQDLAERMRRTREARTRVLKETSACAAHAGA